MSRIPATFISGPITAQGSVKNLSKEGLFLRCSELPEPGDIVHVLLQPPGNPKVEVEGIVRWTTEQLPERAPGQSGFGLVIQLAGILVVIFVIGNTDRRGDGETRRNGQAQKACLAHQGQQVVRRVGRGVAGAQLLGREMPGHEGVDTVQKQLLFLRQVKVHG